MDHLIIRIKEALERKTLDYTKHQDHIIIKFDVLHGTDLLKITKILNGANLKAYFLSAVKNELVMKILTV